jgi:hypothetical protein
MASYKAVDMNEFCVDPNIDDATLPIYVRIILGARYNNRRYCQICDHIKNIDQVFVFSDENKTIYEWVDGHEMNNWFCKFYIGGRNIYANMCYKTDEHGNHKLYIFTLTYGLGLCDRIGAFLEGLAYQSPDTGYVLK